LLGRVLENRYLTEELLSESSSGERYRAYDIATDESVLVDVLPRRALRSWPALRQAVTRMAAHGHPHVAALLARGVFQGAWPYLVFELHGERTLAELIDSEAPPDLRRALRIAIQCSRALAALHAAGLSHGSFSARHVRGGATGSLGEIFKVDGFGLAPQYDDARRSEHEAVRLPSVCCDVAGDIRRLGLVARSLVASERSRDLPRRIFDKIVGRCLTEEPLQRYASAAALSADLGRLEAALDARHVRAEPRELSPTRARVRAMVHAPRPRSRIALRPALPKVIVSPGS
jgi:hypothetical protein